MGKKSARKPVEYDPRKPSTWTVRYEAKRRVDEVAEFLQKAVNKKLDSHFEGPLRHQPPTLKDLAGTSYENSPFVSARGTRAEPPISGGTCGKVLFGKPEDARPWEDLSLSDDAPCALVVSPEGVRQLLECGARREEGTRQNVQEELLRMLGLDPLAVQEKCRKEGVEFRLLLFPDTSLPGGLLAADWRGVLAAVGEANQACMEKLTPHMDTLGAITYAELTAEIGFDVETGTPKAMLKRCRTADAYAQDKRAQGADLAHARAFLFHCYCLPPSFTGNGFVGYADAPEPEDEEEADAATTTATPVRGATPVRRAETKSISSELRVQLCDKDGSGSVFGSSSIAGDTTSPEMIADAFDHIDLSTRISDFADDGDDECGTSAGAAVVMPAMAAAEAEKLMATMTTKGASSSSSSSSSKNNNNSDDISLRATSAAGARGATRGVAEGMVKRLPTVMAAGKSIDDDEVRTGGLPVASIHGAAWVVLAC